MLYDLLNKLPLEMWFLWLIVLFFAFAFIRLGRLGIFGRGVPVTSSRWRLKAPGAKAFSVLLILVGVLLVCCSGYWFGHAVYVRLLSR